MSPEDRKAMAGLLGPQTTDDPAWDAVYEKWHEALRLYRSSDPNAAIEAWDEYKRLLADWHAARRGQR